ncbi:MAG: DUF6573 family protein [Pseudobdellovibrionaceae bacterium]
MHNNISTSKAAKSVFTKEDVVSTYTRQNALEDGLLISVEENILKEAGFKLPLALTSAVFEKLNPTQKETQWGQEYEGRLWDLLNLAKNEMVKNRGTDTARFSVIIARETAKGDRLKHVTEQFKIICHGGDNREPVLTVSLPNED